MMKQLFSIDGQPAISQLELGRGVTLFKFDLGLPVPGFNGFITPWLIREESNGKSRFVLIDPGPASGIPQLLDHLSWLNVEHLECILLTHVHIDHAGGLASLLQAFPDARVLVHNQGRRHLLNPARLWEGSLKTLGELAQAYGQILPVPQSSLLPEGAIPDRFQVIETPGHAPHHQSFLYDFGEGRLLFAGEAAGIYLPGEVSYLRPATPPRFFFEVTMGSLAALIQLEASAICYGHCGFSRHPQRLLRMHREQLFIWREVISAECSQESQPPAAHIVQRLLAEDPLMGAFPSLSEDARHREEYFLENSVKGFLQQTS